MLDELQRKGFILGQNLTVEWRVMEPALISFRNLWRSGSNPRSMPLMHPDAGVRAAQQATATIPILGITQDMVGHGLVNSLPARRQYNRCQRFRDRARREPAGHPDRSRARASSHGGPCRFQGDPVAAASGIAGRGARARRRAFGSSGCHRRRHDAAIEAAKASGAAALNVLSSPLLYGNRQLIMDRVAALRLPAIYAWTEEAEEGGFLTNGLRLLQIFRELMAQQLVKLLQGVKPADIPVEQPTKFELVIN